jgi:hypothetical protein
MSVKKERKDRKKERGKKLRKWVEIRCEPSADNRNYVEFDSLIARIFLRFLCLFAAIPSLRSLRSFAAIPVCVLSQRLGVETPGLVLSSLRDWAR